MQVTTNQNGTFEVSMEDGRYRTWFVTFERANFGTFPKVTKIERMQDNGKYTFRTMYRSCNMGDLPTIISDNIKVASKLVRFQP